MIRQYAFAVGLALTFTGVIICLSHAVSLLMSWVVQ
jgi:hypothetical protein